MKKFAVLALAAVVGLSTVAGAHAQSAFDGAYVGASGGVGFTHLEHEGIPGVVKSDAHGFDAGVFVGYGQTFDNFYLGGEVSADFADIQNQFEANGLTVNLNREGSLAASVRGGYLVTDDTMVYATAGVTSTYFTGANQDGWKSGYRLGVGAEKAVTDELFVRASLDFDFIDRDSMKYQNTTAKVGLGLRF